MTEDQIKIKALEVEVENCKKAIRRLTRAINQASKQVSTIDLVGADK